MPLLANKHLIDVGFLTAAYLCGSARGRTLGPFRTTSSPSGNRCSTRSRASYDRRKYTAWSNALSFSRPTIGLAYLGEDPCLFAGIANQVVLFPPASRPDFYDALPDDFSKAPFRIVRDLAPTRWNAEVEPFLLMMERDVLLFPDCLKKKPTGGAIYFIGAEGDGPTLMQPISKEEHEALAGRPDARSSKQSLVPIQRRVIPIDDEE